MQRNEKFDNIMKKFIFISFVFVVLVSCNNSSSYNQSSSDYQYEDSPEYWQSMSREKALKDAGYKDAAKAEREDRISKVKGNRNGEYNGSLQQKEDLEEIDKRLQEDPNF